MGLFDKLFGTAKKDPKAAPSKNINFTSSDTLMDEDRFWKLIQTTREVSGGDFELQQELLAKELRKLSPDDIIVFGNRFRYFRGQANTWELWGAIYIIQGGCSDDGFNDFREWVIGQGKDFYYKTIHDPESLADLDTDSLGDMDWEGLGYVPSTVFEEMTGQEMPYPFQEQGETQGTEWAEGSDDLKKMFPRLCAKYPDHV